MLNRLIRWSVENRLFVVVFSILLVIYGGWTIVRMPVDVFPDLNRPTVTVMTEAEGLAPEEVETLINFPLESALNGATGVQRVRSVAGIGLSIVYVEFDWSTEIFQARQIVNEKLSTLQGQLPERVLPVMAPISSIMGEIMLLGASSRTGQLSPMQLRTLADWQLRPRLLSIPGVSQVTVIGGQLRQYQVLVDPRKLLDYDVGLEELVTAVRGANQSTSGGFLEQGGQESLVRNLGRVRSLRDVSGSVVEYRQGAPVRVEDVAKVEFGPRVRRGDASVNAQAAVILSIQKQPGANTVELTQKVLQALQEMSQTLPADLVLTPLFQQSHFIEAAVTNVEEALRDGAIMVAIVLFAFLLNLRTTVITLTAIPLSLVVAGLSLKGLGQSINTMTLGGLAVAIGELVDDAVVDVENVYRRLGENRQREHPEDAYQVVFEASSEVRNSIIYSTVLIALVFLPLFFMAGIEGRLFQPLGLAYVIALVASLVVSLTLTPALCSYLLVKAPWLGHRRESPLVRGLKWVQARILHLTLGHPLVTLGAVAVLFGFAMLALTGLGRSFLPPFNEGTMTLTLIAQPGTSLEESNRIGRAAEELLLEIPEVATVGRRTGRAELDEHAEGVHYSEIDVDLRPGRPREAILADVRAAVREIPGVEINLGQPISHRLDHILSGVRAQVAIKLFGPDLPTLRSKAEEIRQTLEGVPGVVDLQIEKQVAIPQLQVRPHPEQAATYGIKAGELADVLAVALGGEVVGQVLEGQRVYDLVVRLDEPFRDRPDVIRKLLVDTPSGKVPLGALARVEETEGPNQVLRENVVRRIVISCNVSGRDLTSTVQAIQKQLAAQVKLPAGYYLEYGGQFESQQSATRTLLTLSLLSGAGIFLVLYHHFRMVRLALMVMVALPLSLIGGVVGVYLTGGVLSIASLVGFITLCGIASRNEIMRLSHYLHLLRYEGETFNEAMIIRGSQERMVPVLMTALTAMLALVPLAISAGAPGKEILQPVAVVIMAGLLSSTVLDTVVTPLLFYHFGRPAADRIARELEAERNTHENAAALAAGPGAGAGPHGEGTSHRTAQEDLS